ncbi:hypothetical protein [Flavobacterium suzhouense]|uniref:Lipoprotein n=1 Tax=Flavobacterium suzhouense TaxID=1529638 RepID=A0ABW5NSK4_9FLAO
MKKLLLFVVLFIISCNSSNKDAAQSIPTFVEWEKTFYGESNDMPKKLHYLENSNQTIILGQRFSDNSNKATTCALVKLDANGKKTKEIFFGSDKDRLTEMAVTENKIILAGYKKSKKLWMQILDLNFKVIKDTVYKDLNITWNIKLKSMGKSVVVGVSHEKEIKNSYINYISMIFLDENLAINWKKEFYSENKMSGQRNIKDICIDKDDIILLSAEKLDQKVTYSLTKLDKGGKVLWSKLKEGELNGYRASNILKFGSGYMVSGNYSKDLTNAGGFKNIFYAAYTAEGKELYLRKTEKEGFAECLTAGQNNSVYIVGSTNNSNWKGRNPDIYNDIFALQVKNDGSMGSEHIFGTVMPDNKPDVVYLGGDSYILAFSSVPSEMNAFGNAWKIYAKKFEQATN